MNQKIKKYRGLGPRRALYLWAQVLLFSGAAQAIDSADCLKLVDQVLAKTWHTDFLDELKRQNLPQPDRLVAVAMVFDLVLTPPSGARLENLQNKTRALLTESLSDNEFFDELALIVDDAELAEVASFGIFKVTKPLSANSKVPGAAGLVEIIDLEDLSQLVVGHIYEIQFLRDDPRTNGSQKFVFHKATVDWLKERGRHLLANRLMKALQMGPARSKRQEGIKKLVQWGESGNPHLYEVKIFGRGDYRMLLDRNPETGVWHALDVVPEAKIK